MLGKNLLRYSILILIIIFTVTISLVSCKSTAPIQNQEQAEDGPLGQSEASPDDLKIRAYKFAQDMVRDSYPDVDLVAGYNQDKVIEEARNVFQITVEGSEGFVWYCVLQYIEAEGDFKVIELVEGGATGELDTEGEYLAEEEIQGEQTKSGVLTDDETWSGEILVTGQVIIPEGVTLNIESGTKVRFQHYRDYKEPWKRTGIEVAGGNIIAVGTPKQQIWFTSDAEEPVNGDWPGIFLNNTSTSRFDYVIVEFGIAGICQFDSEVTISNSIIRWTNSEGLYVERSSPVFENNTLYENGYHEIALEQYNGNVIIRNNIFRNGRVAIHMEETTALVENNYFIDYGDEVISVCAESEATVRNNKFRNISNIEFAVFSDAEATIVMEGNDFGEGDLPIPVFYYEDISEYKLDYIPGDPQDRYQYIFDDEDETRRVIKRIGKGLGFGWSLTYADDFLWTFSFSSQLGKYPDFVKLDPSTGESKRFRNDYIINPRGLLFDGEYFWANDFSLLKIFKFVIDGNSIKTIDSFYVPEKEDGGTNGLAYDGEFLLYHNRDGTRLYKLDQNGTEIERIDIKHAEIISTFVWTGEYFWTIGEKDLIKLTANGGPIGEIYAAAEGTWAVAWDGQYLWIFQRTCEMWNDAKIFQIEVLDDSL